MQRLTDLKQQQINPKTKENYFFSLVIMQFKGHFYMGLRKKDNWIGPRQKDSLLYGCFYLVRIKMSVIMFILSKQSSPCPRTCYRMSKPKYLQWKDDDGNLLQSSKQ